jgi:hypothetical protein
MNNSFVEGIRDRAKWRGKRGQGKREQGLVGQGERGAREGQKSYV